MKNKNEEVLIDDTGFIEKHNVVGKVVVVLCMGISIYLIILGALAIAFQPGLFDANCDITEQRRLMLWERRQQSQSILREEFMK